MTEPELDQWADWLLHRRHGDDDAELQRTRERVGKVRDRVLANAALSPGETLLDVGTGDGLIGFGAIDAVGPEGRVILSDVSRDLLDHARQRAIQQGVADRCAFVQAPADNLGAIASESVDIVTTRSVLAYVKNKTGAFAEFFRVLRPNGRISLYEPINGLVHPEPTHQFDGLDVTPVQDLAAGVKAVYEARQPMASDPMFDYDERSLMRMAREAGFETLHLELRVDQVLREPQEWELYATTAQNPLAPTLSEAINQALSREEGDRFVGHLRPRVERGEGTFTVAVAYLWAEKGPTFPPV
jgi:ubiquinone/menaquinone biosynthesis C-methylase UbiE